MAYTIVTPTQIGDQLSDTNLNAQLVQLENAIYVRQSAMYRIVANTTLGAPAANIDITSIPAIYKHLRIFATLKHDGSIASNDGSFRINNDATAANYASKYSQGTTPTEAAAGVTAAITGLEAQGTSGGLESLFMANIIDFLDYANTSVWKTIIMRGEKNGVLNRASGFWLQTAAINRITLLPPTGNFIAGCSYSLYGFN